MCMTVFFHQLCFSASFKLLPVFMMSLFLSPLQPEIKKFNPYSQAQTPKHEQVLPIDDNHDLKHKERFTLSPDVLGFRAIYGASRLSKKEAVAYSPSKEQDESLYGSAIALEWVLLHHHLEFEFILGVFEHQALVDEFVELVFKLPYHFGEHADLLIGLGGIVETYHQHPEYGITADINARYWLDEAWGLSAEVDYLTFNTGTEGAELIAELLYRF